MEPLADIYEAYRSDPAFDHLRSEHVKLVPGEGSPVPKVFIVGEAPGAAENLHLRPFIGASGKVLRSMISDVAELSATDWFITNVVKYRPQGNRTPEFEEVEASRPYLRREYAALGSPPVLVAVGATAFEALAPGYPGGILSLAGQPHPMPHDRMLWPMVHPAYALRNPKIRPTVEEHWTAFGRWFRFSGRPWN